MHMKNTFTEEVRAKYTPRHRKEHIQHNEESKHHELHWVWPVCVYGDQRNGGGHPRWFWTALPQFFETFQWFQHLAQALQWYRQALAMMVIQAENCCWDTFAICVYSTSLLEVTSCCTKWGMIAINLSVFLWNLASNFKKYTESPYQMIHLVHIINI